MTDRTQIGIDIDAVDNASPVLEGVADESAKIEKLDPKVTVDADTTGVAKGLDDVESHAGKAKDVMHSFAGNMAGDMSGVAQAIGPAGEAVSQLTEGLLAGEVAAGDMVAAMLPMLAVAGPLFAAFKGITGHLQKIKELKAFDADQVKAYGAALKEGLTTAQAIEKTMTDAGKVEFKLDLAGGAVIDITGLMADAGISIDQFSQLVAGSEQHLKDWAAAEKAAGVEVGPVVLAVEDQRQKVQKAAEQQKVYNEVFGKTPEVLEHVDRSQVDFADQLKKSQKAIDDHRDAYDKLMGRYSRRDEFLTAEQNFRDLQQVIDDGTASNIEFEGAVNNAKQSVIEYIEQLAGVPDDVKTTLQAAVDQGSVDHAKAVLDALESTRSAKVEVSLIDADTKKHLGGGGAIRLGPDGELIIGGRSSVSASSATSSVVNINMPAGSKGVDVVRQVSGQARRSGRRYGAQVVHYARR